MNKILLLFIFTSTAGTFNLTQPTPPKKESSYSNAIFELEMQLYEEEHSKNFHVMPRKNENKKPKKETPARLIKQAAISLKLYVQ